MASSVVQPNVCCILLMFVVVGPAALEARQNSQLRFDSNGQFKILQVADMHYGNGGSTKCLDVYPSQMPTCSDLNTTAFINRMIRAEKPDLIVFTGDNIYAKDTEDPQRSMDMAFNPAIEAKIPWAAVLGNHDQESLKMNRENVMKYIASMPGTLSRVNPTQYKIDGFGNYHLQVNGVANSSHGNNRLLDLYFLDSGDYAKDTNISFYDWIKPSQISWFKQISAARAKKRHQEHAVSQQSYVPGLIYFHIPLPDFKYLKNSSIIGVKQENIGSPLYDSGFFKAMVEAENIKAAFVGHDHVNDFCGKLQEIELCYAGGFGYHAYGKAGWSRRSRVVVASLESGYGSVKSISTWKRLDDEHLSKVDVQTLWERENMKAVKSSGFALNCMSCCKWLFLAIAMYLVGNVML